MYYGMLTSGSRAIDSPIRFYHCRFSLKFFIAVYMRCLKLHEKAKQGPDRLADGPANHPASQAVTVVRRTAAAMLCYTLGVILIISDITSK